MTDFLPREVRAGLEAARRNEQKRRSRLCVHVGGEVFHVLRLWDDGFALDATEGKRPASMRGLVDIYDGPRHLSACLVVASVAENGEMICEFKRRSPVLDRPAVDFVRGDDALPVGLLPNPF